MPSPAKLLTRLPFAPGSRDNVRRIAIFGDSHIGIMDDPAMRVLVECFEAEGVDFIVANGDVHDCGPVSRHLGKAKRAALENGQLAEEAAKGRWLINWLATRPGRALYGTGNHEDWINDVALDTNTVGTFTVASALGIPAGIEVLPHGYQIRLGSLVVEHGDVILGRSTGGQHLAANILRRYPNQTTIVNHFHHQDYSVNTTEDAVGVLRSHAAYCLGHTSLPTEHKEYAGRTPNWQQGGALVEVWEADRKPRYSIHLLEVHRDRRNRPMLQFNGRMYK